MWVSAWWTEALYKLGSLQLADTQATSIALTIDEIAALETINLREAQSVEHWMMRLLEGPNAVFGESLLLEATKPNVGAIQPEVPGLPATLESALATALEEQAHRDAQSVEQGSQLIESMGSVPKKPLDRNIASLIFTEEHQAALAAHAQFEVNEVQRLLEIFTTLSE